MHTNLLETQRAQNQATFAKVIRKARRMANKPGIKKPSFAEEDFTKLITRARRMARQAPCIDSNMPAASYAKNRNDSLLIPAAAAGEVSQVSLTCLSNSLAHKQSGLEAVLPAPNPQLVLPPMICSAEIGSL